MREEFLKQKDIVIDIIKELEDVRLFLIGNTPEETANADNMKEDCFFDSMHVQTVNLENALQKAKSISTVIMGGGR